MTDTENKISLGIAGSRYLNPPHRLISELIQMMGLDKSMIKEVICGAARGVDNEGAHWAKLHSIPVRYFQAEWDLHGKKAGPVRNAKMVKEMDQLLLIWDGVSRGSGNMRNQIIRLRKPFYEVVINHVDWREVKKFE